MTTEEPRYVDDPFENVGDGPDAASKKEPPKKWFGTTDLERAALQATGRGPDSRHPGFSNNTQLANFKALEEWCEGMDDRSRVWRAWFEYRIAQAAYLNKDGKGVIKVSLDQLMNMMNPKSPDGVRKRDQWMMDNEVKILRKKSVQEIAGETDTTAGLDNMEKRMGQKPKYED